jgi:2-keto-4-pentenoate hydratase/2-oxohepta-3-ene-1,7-dioic acid hydratase in catechol pathway
MQYCRFLHQGEALYGYVEERRGEPWIVAPAPIPEEDLRARLCALESEPSAFAPLPLSAATLLAPVTPSKIVCVGRNYRDHVKELNSEMPVEPLFFFKPLSALVAPGGVVHLPRLSERVDFEGELALVIGKRVRNLAPDADWRQVVRGYTLADDVSARDLQKKDVQWTRAKGFDSFCPVGPVVSDEIDPEAGVTIETRVNSELRQHASSVDFIFSIPHLLVFITAVMTLEPGDLILTGTPAGVGPLKGGDHVEISLLGIGALRHLVEAD